MKKKFLNLFMIFAFLLTIFPVSTYAVGEVTLNSIGNKTPGSSVTVTGTSVFERISVKVIKPDGTIYDLASISVVDGLFSYTFGLAGDVPEGIYKVVAGRGDVVVNTTFTVEAEEPTPTTEPTEEPTPTTEPTEEPTPTPGTSEEPGPTPSDSPTLSPSDEPEPSEEPDPSEQPEPTPAVTPTITPTTTPEQTTEPTTEPTTTPEPTTVPTEVPEPTPTATPEPAQETQFSIELNSDGSASVKVNEPALEGDTASVSLDKDTLENALDTTWEIGEGIKVVSVEVPGVKGVTSYKFDIPAEFVTMDEYRQEYEFISSVGSIQIPSTMLSEFEMDEDSTVSFEISQVDRESLPEDIRKEIVNRPVVQLSVKVNGESIKWSNENAPVTVSIPYIPGSNEDYEKITVWYITDDGEVLPVYNGRYDASTGMVTFTVTHFSKFAVVYQDKTFDDLEGYDWARRAIEVLASKGIIKGTSEKTYDPAKNIIRADFTLLLVKALGFDNFNTEIESNFDDVTKTDYYYEAVGIAKKIGLVAGRGNNLFDPKAEITRQEMMVICARALRLAGKLGKPEEKADLSAFTDEGDIAPYAYEDIYAMVKEGLVVGSENRINPLGKATRAEAAVLMYRMYNR